MASKGDILLTILAAGLTFNQARNQAANAPGGPRERQRNAAAMAGARDLFAGIGTEEAAQMVNMIDSDPEAALNFATRLYGGPAQALQGMRQRAGRQRQRQQLEDIDVPTTPQARARRQAFADSLAPGATELDAGTLNSLFPQRRNAAQFGIDPQEWSGSSINSFMRSQDELGVPDYSLLQPRQDAAGGVPDNIKLPTGYMWDGQRVRGIPGTMGEQQEMFTEIMRGIREQGFDAYFDSQPTGVKDFYDAYIRSGQVDPLTAILADAIERSNRGGATPPAAGSSGRPGDTPRAREALGR